MRRRLISVLLAVTVVGLGMPAAWADDAECGGAADMTGASATCVKSGAETSAYIAAHAGHTFSIALACTTDNALCSDAPTCQSSGLDGQVYNVHEDGALLDWQACLTAQEAQHLGGVTPGLVTRAFRRLSWPGSVLQIQPPHGRTLVNFETDFFTTNTRTTTRVVTLLGQRVTIQATPTRYTWHFGDTTDLTTTDPGAPYPDLQVTHRYTRLATLTPSVDTTYAGRYRVGTGTWHTIPDTLTVPGPTTTLQILSATPHLVGP